jgi:hypothetical protein
MSSKSLSNRKPVVRCENMNIEQFSISEVDTKNDRSKQQYIYYPRYDYRGNINKASFVFQTDVIQMVQGGLPRKGDKEKGDTYYTEDSARDFIKVPLDPAQPSCVSLRKMLESMDQYVLDNKEEILWPILEQVYSTPKNQISLKKLKELKEKKPKEYKENILDKFEYQYLIRKSQDPNNVLVGGDSDNEDDDGNNKQQNANSMSKMDCAKMKLSIDWNTKEITTGVFVRSNDSNKPVKVPVKTATELSEYVNYKCEARFMVMANKLYVLKNPMDKGIRKFGITLKIMQIETKPGAKSGSLKDTFDDFAFDENDDETEVTLPPASKPVDSKKVAKELEKDNSEDDSEDDESDSEDVKPVVKPAQQVEAKQQEDSSDDEEDSSDDEEEESEEDTPPPPPKKDGLKKKHK